MHTLIIGANGLIGRPLARLFAAAAHGTLTLADRTTPTPPPNATIPVTCRTGDIRDSTFLRTLLEGTDCIIHLAALLAAETEADPAQGHAVNVAALFQLLTLCETLPAPPKFLYASSIAAFGGPLPEAVTDDQPRTPQSTYGTHKAIAELLIDDATRRRHIDGRVLRLPIILVRNGPNTATVSDRIAALIREPLAGRDITCGLHPDTLMPVASAQYAATAFHRLAAIGAARLRPARSMNLPCLSLTATGLAAAVARAPAPNATPKGRITWTPDPALQSLIDTWPRRLASEAATTLALTTPETIDDIIARYTAETHGSAPAHKPGSNQKPT